MSPSPKPMPAGDPRRSRGEVAAGEPELLSAWLDGELEAQAASRLTDRLLADAGLQERLRMLCAAGDALRSHEVAACESQRLCRRVSEALAGEPALLAPRALPAALHWPRSAPLRHLATGGAVAAAALVLAVVALPQLRPAPGSDLARAGRIGPAAALQGVLADAATRSPKLVRSPAFDPYIDAHRDLAGSGVMPTAVTYLRAGGEGDR